MFFAACALLPCSTRGQVDPSGAWRTWHTEHFRIHAKASLSTAALKASREAERAYAALSAELKPPSGRIDLVLSDDADYSNGLTTVFPSNRITVYLTPPSTSSSIGVYDSWLRLVITHELTHVFHLDRADGIWRVLQKLFGRAPGLFPNTYQPEWVSEGIAIYYESRLTAAGRLRGGYHTQLLRAAARDGPWPASSDAVGMNAVWPGGTRSYAWGSHFFESQRTLYGDSVVPRFIDRTSRQLLTFNVSGPMKQAGGESVGKGWERLREPAAAPNENYRILERGSRVGPKPQVSPDGSRVCIRRLEGKNDEHVVVLDLRTGVELASKRVTTTGGIAWVGDTLYVTQMDYSSPVQVRSDVYRWEPDGSWERISRGARHTDVFPAGAGRLGVVSVHSGAMTVGEVRYPVSASSKFPVPSSATGWGRIAVSPDGRWVAAARHADEQWDIVLWPAGRPDEFKIVTNDVALDADPAWSSDGESLLFSSERSGLPQIYVYERLSGRIERLTGEPTGARHPAVVGDGTFLFSTVFGDGHALIQQRMQAFSLRELPGQVDSTPAVLVPDVSVREGGYAPWPALRPHFWIPIAHDEQRAGLFLGAMTLGADAIGRTGYRAALTAAPENDRIEAVFYLSHKRWRSWALEFAAAQTWDYAPFLSDGAVVPVSFVERAAELGINYQWRRWRTGAEFRVRGFVERDVLVNEGSEPLPFAPENPAFVGVSISTGTASASRPILAISPENGFSVSTLFLRRWQLGGSGFWSYEARGGIAGYLALSLPGFSHWVLAGSIVAGRSGGPAPTSYSVGGESGDVITLLPGTALGSGRRTFQMRGYSARGGFTRAVVGVAELRIPIALPAKGVPKLPLFLDKISLNLFGEIGNGWNEGGAADLTALRDAGAEMAVDLGLGAGFALRVRVGGAVAFAEGLGVARGDHRYYVAFERPF